MTDREDIFIPEHKTNILPFRWFINGVVHRLSYWFFMRGLKINYKYEDIWDKAPAFKPPFLDNIKLKLYFKIYHYLDKPYMRWGTTYVMSTEFQSLVNMEGAEWSDYDEDGVPYWDLYWHEDPVTGDAWRLIKNG
jgi:hypothetical protein